MVKIGVIIQARMGSTRLPGKIMKEIKDKSILAHDVKRIQRAKQVSEIIIATSDKEADLAIVSEAKKIGAKAFRGSEQNVLERYYLAAREHNLDVVVRITSDCPLYDPELLDKMILEFKRLDCDYLSNCLVRTYPRGLDTEIFTFSALERAYKEGKQGFEQEHVTPYINRHPEIFRLKDFVGEVDNSHLRWTLDTEEDFSFIEEVYNALYKENEFFSTADILDLLQKNPKLIEINAHIEQKKVGKL